VESEPATWVRVTALLAPAESSGFKLSSLSHECNECKSQETQSEGIDKKSIKTKTKALHKTGRGPEWVASELWV
jgi:hypothetical protein